MRHAIYTFLFLGATFTLESASYAEGCGAVFQSHYQPSFRISSRMHTSPPFDIFVACVENPSYSGYLPFRWYLPKLQTYLPPGKTQETPRIFLSEGRPKNYLGCYEYGNLLSVDEAWFIGAEAELSSVETEREKGCRATQRDHAAILKYFQRVEDKAAFTRELGDRPLNINYSTFVSDQMGQNREPRLSFVLQLYIGLELITEGDNNFVQNTITIQTSRTDGFNQEIAISPDTDNDDRFVEKDMASVMR